MLSFDNGYASQYTNALPVLKRLGWVGVENIQLTGLPPSQGGLTDAQVRGLLAAGWELDTQGISHADLIPLDAGRAALPGRHRPADAAPALRRSGELVLLPVGSLQRHRDRRGQGRRVRRLDHRGARLGQPQPMIPIALPRLRVLGGTSPSALLAQIAAAQSAARPARRTYRA